MFDAQSVIHSFMLHNLILGHFIVFPLFLEGHISYIWLHLNVECLSLSSVDVLNFVCQSSQYIYFILGWVTCYLFVLFYIGSPKSLLLQQTSYSVRGITSMWGSYRCYVWFFFCYCCVFPFLSKHINGHKSLQFYLQF